MLVVYNGHSIIGNLMPPVYNVAFSIGNFMPVIYIDEPQSCILMLIVA